MDNAKKKNHQDSLMNQDNPHLKTSASLSLLENINKTIEATIYFRNYFISFTRQQIFKATR